MEDWRQLREFPDYSVSSMGRVRNDVTGRIMALSKNQHGIVNVGLMREGKQYKRSITLLVASEFLPEPKAPFDTPISLDGDRENNSVENLAWRPRWFAIKYHMQFGDENRIGFDEPVVEVNSGEEFPNTWEACVKYGLLERELVLAIHNKTFVFPTYQIYELA